MRLRTAAAVLLPAALCLSDPGFSRGASQTGSELRFQDLGVGHTSVFLSSAYPDGGRVLWTSGESVVAKIDAATFDVIATLRRSGAASDDGARRERLIGLLDDLARPPADRIAAAAAEGFRTPAPPGALLDADNRLLVPEGRSIAAYGDAEPGARLSGIRVAQRFNLPASIPGRIARLARTRDGTVVAATSAGVVLALARGFSRLTTVVLPHAPGKDSSSAWVHGGPVADDRDGLFIASTHHLHRIAWTGSNLSVADSDGAWSEPVQGGCAEGAVPSLLGTGEDRDRLVAIASGDPPSTLTLLWRDDVGRDDRAEVKSSGNPGERVTGGAPATGRIAASQPIAFDAAGSSRPGAAAAPILATLGDGILAFAATPSLPIDPTPRGMKKWTWNRRTRALESAWSKSDTGAVSGAPVVTTRAVWFVAVKDGRCAVEGLDWGSGAPIATRPLGGARFLSPGAQPILDPEGRFVTGTLFGVARVSLAR